MTGFARRPLVVLIGCLFAAASASHAADDAVRPPAAQGKAGNLSRSTTSTATLPLAASDPEPRLRIERKFNVMGKPNAKKSPEVGIDAPVVLKKDESYPLFIIADHLQGQLDEVTEAEGNVELRKAGALVFADKVKYWPLDDEIDAVGNVRILQEGTEIHTPHLRMKLTEQIGFAERADYHMVKQVKSEFYSQQHTVVTVASSNAASTGAPMMMNVPNSYGLPTTVAETRLSEASGYAERTDFEGENQIRLTSATYSTCKPGQTDWYLGASEIHLDYDKDEAEAKHAALWFKGVPIFYSPVASFPLNNQRRSGVLQPNFSTSTKNGFDFTVPYYWNIAPDYDVTLRPRFMTKRGFQLGAEVNYLDYNYRGSTKAEYLPSDAIENRSRYAYNIQHQHNLGRGFSGTVNWNGVSDDRYWEDMSSRLLQTSQKQLPKQVVLGFSPFSWLQTSTQVLRYQTLQPDPANPIARPYFLEPQLNIVGYKPNVLKTDLSLISQYSRFTHPDKINGDRFVFYPQVSLPIVHPAFQITPKIGVNMTKYSLEQPNVGESSSSVTRTLPIFTLDSTVTFERESKWLDTDYIQTLEPRLYYVNIPYKNQDQIPVFDSGLSDFNFAQIFAENRYSGFDRINDANQLTAAVTTRYLDAASGVERFKAMLGQRYYFKPQRVTLPGESPRTEDFSNLVAAVNGLVLPKTYADAAWEYNYRDSVSERFSAGLRFQPELGKVLSASYRYTRDPIKDISTVDQVDLAGQWPISANWYAVGRYNYSLRDKQLLEAIGGVEYNAGCWAARFVAQRLEAVSGAPNTTLFFQLELSDFGSIGSNPLGLLRRSIPGYGKTNELPNSGSLFSPQ
jgi:LPS-assembly protein